MSKILLSFQHNVRKDLVSHPAANLVISVNIFSFKHGCLCWKSAILNYWIKDWRLDGKPSISGHNVDSKFLLIFMWETTSRIIAGFLHFISNQSHPIFALDNFSLIYFVTIVHLHLYITGLKYIFDYVQQ